jgi:hypothetical protein
MGGVLLVVVFGLVHMVRASAPRTPAPRTFAPRTPNPADMNSLAERYVRLVLALGQHDRDYVDAYYGPPEWRRDAETMPLTLDAIDDRADALQRDLDAAAPSAGADEITRLRHEYLEKQLESLRARAAMLGGRRMTFDEESKALYDAVAPHHTEQEFQRVLADLERQLPGNGTLRERYEAFRSRFIIPRDRLDATFKAAIDACRARTLQHITLPPGESFTVEYVTHRSWSGYNWYHGQYRSVIQVNTDLPIYVDRAIDLACHEGYPGHHVYNTLLEKNLVRDRGWVEFSVYPLFSPQSLIAEGTANYGINVAFPPAERVDFERRVIFPAAGLDPSQADRYNAVLALVDRLAYAGNEAARRYLDGDITAGAAAGWLEQFGLYSRPGAEQRVRFIDQYRSYVINYNVGKDMVARYIESQGGTASNPQRRWQLFERLLSSPRLPSSLTAGHSSTDRR